MTAWGAVGAICTMAFIQERGGLMTVVCVDEDGVPVNAAFSLVLHKS